MTISDLKQKIESDSELAFVIGNGVNKYASNATSDWQTILISLWNSINRDRISGSVKGLSLTEIYDLLSLQAVDYNDIRDRFIEQINNIHFTEYHQKLQQRLKEINRPVLTTNFDMLLDEDLNIYKFKGSKRFTDHYPWECCWTNQSLSDTISGFGIWHINGTKFYKRSIKLGLTEYINMAARVKSMLHYSNSPIDTFDGKNRTCWEGMNTWLHIIFNCNLLFFGLGLERDETFLRWLLIERAKYYEKFPYRRHSGWYVCPETETSQGKRLFLENVGIDIVEVNDYDDIYKTMFNIP